ncbi:hypothetical protein [Cellulomonas biazotea]|uniref:Carboxypeptidase regulatory-like domain-containing protein n=1 Tax=Cellulomonas biazotea TaxID=1709 RepID=A0A402DQQ4_9CELL|nr:hypothetical protein [Cellulomonas biazotea]GCE76438.1 hypothetical protein CBZ_14940 [Cellulomonas biazotea]
MSHDDVDGRPAGTHAPGSPDDQRLLDRLRAMWLVRDRPPDDLVDAVVARMAASDLDRQWELLSLVHATDRLAGVRGLDGPRTLTFSGDLVTVVVRVSSEAEDRRRVDGWVVPPAPLVVRAFRAAAELASTTATADGRFELADLPAGTTTLRLGPTDDHADAATRPHLVSPPFEL